MSTLASESLVRTIRLSEEQLSDLLDRLDQMAPIGADGTDKGTAATYRYRTLLQVQIHNTGRGASSTYQVPTHTISARRLSFLYGGYIHAGTFCVAKLTTHHGSWNNAPGKVVACRYVEAAIHEVCLQFDRMIDPALYSPEAVQPRVLLVEDDPSLARLTEYHLEQLHIKFQSTVDGEAAEKKAMTEPYDLILLDMELPGKDGFDVAKTLRRAGYTGSIVALTALTQPNDRERCLAAGCDQYFPKPYTRQDLANLIRSLHREPLFSSLSNDPSMSPIIRRFVDELPDKLRLLAQHLHRGELADVIDRVRKLKAEGASYGFEEISEAALEVENALMQGNALDSQKQQITELIQLCSQARAADMGTFDSSSSEDSIEGLRRGGAISSDGTSWNPTVD